MNLIKISKSDTDLWRWMVEHYSAPKGFVGRQLIYKIDHEGTVFGAIVAGSATRHLPGRETTIPLNNLVNNTFFHIKGPYPLRNFATRVVALWREKVAFDWWLHYGDEVLGWETLVELPRTGELYRRDGWKEVGLTKGFTCKRVGGQGTDSWSGKRVWDTKNLRPKRVFIRAMK